MASTFGRILGEAKRRALSSGLAGIDARALHEAAGSLFDLGDFGTRPRHRNEAVIRSLCRNAYLGDHTAICRVLGRYKLFVDTGDLGLSSHLLTEGYWEMWHTEAMARFVKPGMTAIDVGANLGYFTILLGDLVGPGGTVHAFEPNPHVAALLTSSVEINGHAARTTIYEMALSDAAGTAALRVPPNQPKNAHIVKARVGSDDPVIQLKRLDGFPDLLEADFIKIDVEGAEEAVWRGMRGLLESRRPLTVILEFTRYRYKDAGAFVDELTAHGFSTAVIDPRKGVIPISRAELLDAPGAEDQLVVLRR